MGDTLPAQLLYLVIFNPTLKPATASDDDDDLEQATILLYTARSRAVSRDTMLRQVGLAKALINFSELFTPEAGCDDVHSQRKRMIMHSPEPNFWIHICVQLPSMKREPPRPSKLKSKGKEKQTPTPPPKADAIDYIDNTLHDSVLRADLAAAYEGFRLAHGTFREVMDAQGVPALEALIEQYFNVWAWKWQPSVALDLPLHLGVPLHPRHQRLEHVVADLRLGLPSDAVSFVLQQDPPSLLSPLHTSSPDLRALVQYMLIVSRPAIPSSISQPSSEQAPKSQLLSLSDSTATIIPPAASTLSSLPTSRTNESLTSSPRPMSQIGTTIAAPFTQAGTYLKPTLDAVVNPKKWWPDYLSISRSPSRQEGLMSPPRTDSPNLGASPSTKSVPDSSSQTNVKDIAAGAEAESDASTAPSGDEKSTIHPSHSKDSSTLDVPSSTSHDAETESIIDQDALTDAMIDSTPPRSEAGSELFPPLPDSPPPPPPLNVLTVRMSDPERDGRTEARTVLHVQNHGLIFFVLLPSSGSSPSESDPELDDFVDDHLRMISHVLENPSMTDLLQPVSTAPSRAVLYDEGSSTTSVVSTAPYAGHPALFAAHEGFRTHPTLQEIISRTTSNQWFASRRNIVSSSRGAETNGDSNTATITSKVAFLEAGNTQASLVDIDSELSALIRQKAW